MILFNFTKLFLERPTLNKHQIFETKKVKYFI